MHVTVLAENISYGREMDVESSLSLHVQTAHHNILFNLGLEETYVEMAKKCGVRIEEIDIVVLAGSRQTDGIRIFLKYNHQACFYMLAPDYEFYKEVLEEVEAKRVVCVEEALEIDSECSLFSQMKHASRTRKPNAKELHLMVQEEGRHYLFVNHAMQGTINVVDEAEARGGQMVNGVFGGFYFYNDKQKEYEEDSFITLVVVLMKKKKTLFYTSHVSGERAFGQLKDFMQDNMRVLKQGQGLEL